MLGSTEPPSSMWCPHLHLQTCLRFPPSQQRAPALLSHQRAGQFVCCCGRKEARKEEAFSAINARLGKPSTSAASPRQEGTRSPWHPNLGDTGLSPSCGKQRRGIAPAGAGGWIFWAETQAAPPSPEGTEKPQNPSPASVKQNI